MASYQNRTFGQKDVAVDGHSFDGCTFKGTNLVYSGGTPPSFTKCRFVEIKISFEGLAGNTVAFMRAMAGPNSGMQKVVRETFPGLRMN